MPSTASRSATLASTVRLFIDWGRSSRTVATPESSSTVTGAAPASEAAPAAASEAGAEAGSEEVSRELSVMQGLPPGDAPAEPVHRERVGVPHRTVVGDNRPRHDVPGPVPA